MFRDGFQFVSVSFFAIAVPLAGVVLLKRQWLLGQRYGYMTAGEMFSDYFGGHGLRLISVGIALLFGVAFVGVFFSASGALVSQLTGGEFSRELAMWTLSAMVLLYAVTGGMQAVAGDAAALRREIQRLRPTLMQATPATWNMLMA